MLPHVRMSVVFIEGSQGSPTYPSVKRKHSEKTLTQWQLSTTNNTNWHGSEHGSPR
jgi:hypothetical protein